MSEIMTNVDNFWLHMDHPTNLMIITAVMEFEEQLDYERLKKLLEDRLLSFDKFKMRVVKPVSGVGLPIWEQDPTFDIKSHLHRIALPEPGDKKALQEMISDFTSIPLDRTKPLWQIHLIENYGKGSVVFARIHHCIADGIALIHVLLSLADSVPDADTPIFSSRSKKKIKRIIRRPGLKSKIQNTFNNIQEISSKIKKECIESLTNPFHLFEVMRVSTGIAADFASVLTKLSVMPPDPKTAFKGKLGVPKFVAWTEPIPINEVKMVGKAVRAPVNDVLISTVSGGLRRYLQKRNDRVNELDLRVAVPVNVRRRGQEFELGNKFSLIFLPLPIHVEDPIMRLREVKRRMDNLKTSPDAIVGFQALNALGMSPANIAKRAANYLANKSSGVLTNVPGPKFPLYFAGKKITNMMFWVPKTGQVSIGISIISYNGNVTLGISGDAGLIPDPEAVLDGFKDEFKYIVKLAHSGKVDKDPLVINDMRSVSDDNKKEETKLEHEAIFYPSLADTRLKEDTVADYFSDVESVEDVKESNNKENDNEPILEDSNAKDNKTEQREEKQQCGALTKSGQQCKKNALQGSDFCKVHQGKSINPFENMSIGD